MTTKHDGGPAFPVSAEVAAAQGMAGDISGMSLRQYFAAKAPPPPDWWMKMYASRANDLRTFADCIVQWNYVYADAMLAERSKP